MAYGFTHCDVQLRAMLPLVVWVLNLPWDMRGLLYSTQHAAPASYPSSRGLYSIEPSLYNPIYMDIININNYIEGKFPI